MHQFFYKIKTFDSITNHTQRKIDFYLKTNKNRNYGVDLFKKNNTFTKVKFFINNFFNKIKTHNKFFFRLNGGVSLTSLINFSTIVYEVKSFKVRFLRKKTSMFDRFNMYRFFVKKRWANRKYPRTLAYSFKRREFVKLNNPYPRKSRDNLKKRNQFMRKIFFKNSWIKTLWRKREEVKKQLGLKFRYQKKFTRYVTQFRGKVTISLLKYNFFNLVHVLRMTNLFVANSTARELVQAGTLFINSLPVRNETLLLVKGDLVSFKVSWNLLIYLSYQKSIYQDYMKIFNKMYYGFLMKRKKDKGFFHWNSYFDFFKKPTPSFIEVDFLSLNFLVLKEVDNNYIQRKTDSLALPYNAFQLLNWKFII